MSYTKTTWKDNTSPAINQDNLNKIENGIYNLHNTATYVENQVDGLVNKVNNNDSNSVNLKSQTESTAPIVRDAVDYVTTANDSVNNKRKECTAIVDETMHDVYTISNTITDLSLWDSEHVFGIDYYAKLIAKKVCRSVLSGGSEDPKCFVYEGVLYFCDVEGMPDDILIEEEEDPHLIGGGD
jgi:hypothetical protein